MSLKPLTYNEGFWERRLESLYFDKAKGCTIGGYGMKSLGVYRSKLLTISTWSWYWVFFPVLGISLVGVSGCLGYFKNESFKISESLLLLQTISFWPVFECWSNVITDGFDNSFYRSIISFETILDELRSLPVTLRLELFLFTGIIYAFLLVSSKAPVVVVGYSNFCLILKFCL